MTDLPPGWAMTTLGEVASSVKNGIFVSRAGTQPDGVPILRISAVRPGQLHLDDVRYSGQDIATLADADSLLDADDLLFTRYNGNIDLVGACAIVPPGIGELTYPDKLIRVRVDTNVVIPRYVTYAFASPRLRSQVRAVARTTAGQVGISGSSLRSVRLPLPPPAEQRRIVAVLDDLLSRLDTAEVDVSTGVRRLASWREAILRAAVSGGLNGSNRGWNKATIGELAHVGTGATPLRSRRDYYDGGTIPWVTSALLNRPYVDRAEQYITESALEETTVKLWPPGAILVALYGEGKTRGRSSELRIRAATNQACAAIVLHEENAPRRRWIRLFLDATYQQNRRLAVGGVQPNLSLSLIRAIEVPLPPPDAELAILNEVDRLMSVGEVLATQLARANQRSKILRASILSLAFAGRLVSQDPGDESASVRLEQMRQERAAQPKPQRRGRTASGRQKETLL